MKNFLFLVILLLVVAGVWHDLTRGSLPQKETAVIHETDSAPASHTSIASQTVKVKRGDTVLSILEEIHHGQLPVDISQAVNDFNRLNKGMTPEEVQIGQSYQFPVYE
ncbi:hypothetical protein [Bacillus sp. REN10]|uniref:hypothetical protein n=1 Tax=Bacillus sp. REN10 TaxID=2782541 RepID=UPI00193B2633|nr:hypothetical protein [Bacillus sp. REN10]